MPFSKRVSSKRKVNPDGLFKIDNFTKELVKAARLNGTPPTLDQIIQSDREIKKMRSLNVLKDLSFYRDFALCPVLNPTNAGRISFTRASSKTIVGSDGLLKTVGTNVPAFSYDPATGMAQGLDIEEARTNLLLHNQNLSNVVWTKLNGAITPDTLIAPDGTLTADTFIETAAAGFRFFDQSATLPTNPTFSIFLKPAGRTWCSLQITTGAIYSYFNLSGAGSLGTTAGLIGRSITAYPNGWYLVSATANIAGGTGVARVLIATGDGGGSYTGDGVAQPYRVTIGTVTCGIVLRWDTGWVTIDLVVVETSYGRGTIST
jgi:hypothetical protein